MRTMRKRDGVPAWSNFWLNDVSKGLMTKPSAQDLPAGAWQKLTNTRLVANGRAEKRPGLTKKTASPLGSYD